MIRDYDKKLTAKQKAREMIFQAVMGRLQTVYKDLDDDPINEGMTEKERAEVERHLENYLKRIERLVS